MDDREYFGLLGLRRDARLSVAENQTIEDTIDTLLRYKNILGRVRALSRNGHDETSALKSIHDLVMDFDAP